MRNPFFFGALLVLLAFSLSQCSYTQKIRDGATAYKQKQFDVAIDMLKKEYDREKSRVNQGKLAYMLGESYRETNQIEKAIQWYKQAYDYAYGFEALREYAYALKQNEQYEEAMQAFKDLGIEIGSPYEYRKEITACTIALEWQKDPNKEYIVELADFNTAFADYAPALYGEDQLVFTSDRRNATGDDTYNWTGNNFSDLFLIDLSNQSVEAFDPNLNSTNNEGTAVFNKDFTEVYFTRCFSGEKFADNFCKLMMSRKTGSSWTVPVVLNFVEEETNYGHPALSEDGNILYFSANHKEGWGGYDLYYSVRTPDGWDFPRLMNRSINTPRNEQFPFIDADTLYFASDGHTGMGGLDIFRTYKLANGSWSPAQNLKTPINSGEDDFAFVIDRRQPPMGDILQTGYFTSTRRQGIGNDDIYQFTRRIPPDEPEIVETPKEYKMILNGYVLEKIYQVADNPNSKVLGRKPLNNADVDIIFRDTSYKVTVGDDGFFSLELEEQMDYYFLASKEEYLKNENRFSTKGIGKDPNMPVQTFELEIELDRIFKNTEITLEDIYYDFDKSFIRDDAKPTLNKLAENLLLNPDIKIRMASHTDCRGNDRYNEDLSQRRAQAAVDYLISKGISAERLSAKGFGEQVPNVDCLCSRCTEEEHQQNRRTTFAIIE